MSRYAAPPVHTLADVGRDDGPADAIAHGVLTGPVPLFGSDGNPAVRMEGVLFALLGTAAPEVLRAWFAALAEGGRVVDPLSERPWKAWDGQVRDRFGLTWLIGWEPAAEV